MDKTLVAEACTFIGLDIEIRLFVFSDIDYVKFSNTIRFAEINRRAYLVLLYLITGQ